MVGSIEFCIYLQTTFSQSTFVNFPTVSSVSRASLSSSLFCSSFLLFRENLESLDYPDTLADKALRWVLSDGTRCILTTSGLITPWLESSAPLPPDIRFMH